jgi:hypothetical protein
MKTILIKLAVVLALGGGFFYMDKRGDRPKEFTLYAMGGAACAGIAIGFLGGLFQKKSKESK